MIPPRIAPLLAATVLLAGGCRDTNVDPGPQYPPLGAIVSGDLQRQTVGTELPEPLVVRVTDQGGTPLRGEAVTFAVTAGGGSLFAATVHTNAAGEASTRWTLGTVAGDTQRVEARMIDPGSSAPVVLATFRAVGLADAPAAITARPPAARTGGAGEPLADSLEAVVQDAHGNPVAGVPVVWQVVSGGGTVSPATATTGPAGIARAQWTLGLQLGAAHEAEASLSPAVRAQFTAVAGVPVGASLVKVSGDGQAGTVGTALPAPVVVELRTAIGQPLAGAAVTWTPAAGSGTAMPPVSITGLDGRASTAWTLGTTAGPQQLMASVAGVETVTFGAQGQAGAPASITALPPAARTGSAGQPLPDPLEARVQDTHGNPVAGATVAWAVTAGGGSITPATAATDAAGVARAQWTLGPQMGVQHAARASLGAGSAAQFTATAGIPSGAVLVKVSGDGQTGTAGAALTQSAVVELRTAGGVPIAGASVGWTASGSGTAAPPASVTGADGRAATTWTLGTTVGGQQLSAATPGVAPATFAATAAPGAPASLTATGGDGQTAPPNAPLPQPLSVRVVDAHGNPVPGATVSWSVTAGGGSVTPAQAATDANGAAQAQWTLGPAEGPNTATAAVPGTTPVAFAATAQVGPVDSIEVTPAAPTLASLGATVQLTARAVDAYGNTVSGVAIAWSSVTPSVASVSGTGLVTAQANGSTQIRASGAGTVGTAQVTVQQVPATVAVTRLGGGAIVEYDTLRLSAVVRDARGNVMADAPVTWASSAPDIASISATGLVMARGAGTPTFTATAQNGVSGTRVLTLVAGFKADTIAVGAFDTCALRSGTPWCWGLSGTRQLGYPNTNPSVTPRVVPGGYTFASITTGDARTGREHFQSHTCGVEADGDAFCWGNNESGQLGYQDGRPTTFDVADRPACTRDVHGYICTEIPQQVEGTQDWAQLDAGTNHTCGVTTTGAAYCWGSNVTGMLGTTEAVGQCFYYEVGTAFPCALTPRLVAGGLAFRQVSAGEDFTCALTTGGQAYCWGRNNVGQLGDGSTTQRNTPVAVAGGTAFARISAGRLHTCAVTAGGQAYCWGSNADGRLGIGAADATPRTTPQALPGTFRTVSTGNRTSCGITSAGRLACWGLNQFGMIVPTAPIGATYPSPTLYNTTRVFDDAGVGRNFACTRLASDGAIFCWGNESAERGGSSGPGRGAVRAP